LDRAYRRAEQHRAQGTGKPLNRDVGAELILAFAGEGQKERVGAGGEQQVL